MENKKEKVLAALRRRYNGLEVVEVGNRVRIGQVIIEWPEARIKAQEIENK